MPRLSVYSVSHLTSVLELWRLSAGFSHVHAIFLHEEEPKAELECENHQTRLLWDLFVVDVFSQNQTF